MKYDIQNQVHDIQVVNGDAKEPSDDQTPVKTDRQSTWADLGYKAKFLFPFAWPKKDPILQVVVVICGGLLVAGRIVNLFIPIYNKKIGTGVFIEFLRWGLGCYAI